MSVKGVAIKGAILSLALSLAVTSCAMATTVTTTTSTDAGSDVGINLGGWLSGLGKDVLIPVAGLFGVGALFRRDIGAALVVALIAIIVGVFVYDPAGAQNLIQGVANTLTKP